MLAKPDLKQTEQGTKSTPQTGASQFDHRALSMRDRQVSGEQKQRSRQATILIDATREFSLLKRPDNGEIEQFKELFYQFIDRLDKSERRLVSAMLARSAFSPRAVALYLAQDALEIAAPFLLFSPVLTDLDLRAIAAKRGKVFADVIAKRQLPMEPFTAQRLKEAPMLRTAAHRPKQNEEKWHSGDELVALAGVGGRLGRKKPEATVKTVKTTADTIDAAPVEPETVTETVKRAEFRLPKKELRQMLSMARQRDMSGFAGLVEELCGLEKSATLKLLCANQGQEALYLIKALGIEAPHDLQLVLMLLPHVGRSIENYRAAKQTLAELEPGICRMIFNEIGAKFEIGATPMMPPQQAPAPAAEPVQKQSIQGAMNERRRSVLRERDNTLSGLAPMERWPNSGILQHAS